MRVDGRRPEILVVGTRRGKPLRLQEVAEQLFFQVDQPLGDLRPDQLGSCLADEVLDLAAILCDKMPERREGGSG